MPRTQGEALIGGVRYRGPSWPLATVGAVLEARAFHPAAAPGRTWPRWPRATTSPVPGRQVLDVGLSERPTGGPARTPSAWRQRLGIAAALLGDPGVLILDEPVNGLDPEGIRWIRDLLRELAAEGRTVFVSSHLIAEMALTADRLVVIGRGRLLAETTVAELAAGDDSPGGRVPRGSTAAATDFAGGAR